MNGGPTRTAVSDSGTVARGVPWPGQCRGLGDGGGSGRVPAAGSSAKRLGSSARRPSSIRSTLGPPGSSCMDAASVTTTHKDGGGLHWSQLRGGLAGFHAQSEHDDRSDGPVAPWRRSFSPCLEREASMHAESIRPSSPTAAKGGSWRLDAWRARWMSIPCRRAPSSPPDAAQVARRAIVRDPGTLRFRPEGVPRDHSDRLDVPAALGMLIHRAARPLRPAPPQRRPRPPIRNAAPRSEALDGYPARTGG